jgi:flavin-binding protein dodecin
MTSREGAIDFSAKTAIASRALAHADDHVYRVIEIVGTSEESIEDAINAAIGRATTTLRHLRWFEVVRTSGHVEEGQVRHYQVTLKVGFTMEDAA